MLEHQCVFSFCFACLTECKCIESALRKNIFSDQFKGNRLDSSKFIALTMHSQVTFYLMVPESKPFEKFICWDCLLLWALVLVTLGVYQVFRVHSEPGLPNLVCFVPFSFWGWTEDLACMSQLLIHWVKSPDFPDLIPEQFLSIVHLVEAFPSKILPPGVIDTNLSFTISYSLCLSNLFSTNLIFFNAYLCAKAPLPIHFWYS